MLLVIHVQIRHPSKDLACHPGLVLPLKIVIVHSDASSDLSHCSRLSKERYHEPFVPSARYSDNRRLRSRESPSPKQVRVAFKGFPLSTANGFASRGSPSPSEWDSPQGVSPLHSEWDSLQGGPLPQSEWDSPQGVPPLHSEWDSLQGGPLLQSEWDSPQGGPPLQGVPFSKANGICFKGVPFSKASGIRLKGVPLSNSNESRLKGFPPLQCEWDSLQGGPLLQSEWDSLQGIPPLHSDSVSLQGTLLHLDISTHPVLRLVITPLRDPIRGLLLPVHLPLPRR